MTSRAVMAGGVAIAVTGVALVVADPLNRWFPLGGVCAIFLGIAPSWHRFVVRGQNRVTGSQPVRRLVGGASLAAVFVWALVGWFLGWVVGDPGSGSSAAFKVYLGGTFLGMMVGALIMVVRQAPSDNPEYDEEEP